MRYRTKVDRWIAGVVGGALVLELVAAALLVTSLGAVGALLGAASLATFLGIIRLAAWPVTYDVSDDEIRVRCGLWGFAVPLRGIVAAFPSRNPMSAPAWSLDRIQIEYVEPSGRKRMALLSPPDRDAFLADLARRDRGLVVAGGRLARSR